MCIKQVCFLAAVYSTTNTNVTPLHALYCVVEIFSAEIFNASESKSDLVA